MTWSSFWTVASAAFFEVSAIVSVAVISGVFFGANQWVSQDIVSKQVKTEAVFHLNATTCLHNSLRRHTAARNKPK